MTQLKQGVAPERLALAAALGIVLGITPLLGANGSSTRPP